jgi:hypothetical protein
MHKLDLQGNLSGVGASSDRRAATFVERRAGKDRRTTEAGPPGKRERRTTLEARKPQVVEVEMSSSDWALFTDAPLPPGAPGR